MSKKYSTEQIQQFVDAFSLFNSSLNGDAEGPLAQERKEAIDRFSVTGFPTTKHEEWKYTNVQPIVRNHFRPVLSGEEISFDPDTLAELSYTGDAWRLVFVNGHLMPAHSAVEGLPEGVIVQDLASAIREHTDLVTRHILNYGEEFESPFVALNTAHLRDGGFVFIPKNVTLEKPIHLLYLTASSDQPVVTYPRTLIVAEDGAEGTVLEEYAGKDGEVYLTNAVSEAVTGNNTRLVHVKVQHESLQAYHVHASWATLQRDTNYLNNSLSFGARIARNDPWAVLKGEGGHAAIDGLYLAGEDQLIDSHTSIDHTVPHCTSHELYKGILRENGHGVFNGKIFVRQDAQKTDSVQSNMNLLLSDRAEIDTKPQLEIFADDVKCTHGATIGRLDETAIFYLRSRGIGVNEAQEILTYAFAAEVIEHIGNEDVQKYAMTLLDKYTELPGS